MTNVTTKNTTQSTYFVDKPSNRATHRLLRYNHGLMGWEGTGKQLPHGSLRYFVLAIVLVRLMRQGPLVARL